MTELYSGPEWEKKTGIKIGEANGWQFPMENYQPRDFNDKISQSEFMARALRSAITLGKMDNESQKEWDSFLDLLPRKLSKKIKQLEKKYNAR